MAPRLRARSKTQGLEIVADVQDLPPLRGLISLYVQYRKDGDGALIRELTYIALTVSIATFSWDLRDIIERKELVVSAEELGLKLRETWASSHKNYFRRYASGQTSVLCVTASDYDRLSDRVVLSFQNDRETTPYARGLNRFIENTCQNQQGQLRKIYASCYRYTKAVHSLTVGPHCISDPTLAYVFINPTAMSSGICAYITNAASEEVNSTWVIRQLVQMVVVLWDCAYLESKNIFHPGGKEEDKKILLWIVLYPQWDRYSAIKSTLTMPGMHKVHESLACFRNVLLRHNCRIDVRGFHGGKSGHRNFQLDIQDACNNCGFSCDSSPNLPGPEFRFCHEDFVLDYRVAISIEWFRIILNIKEQFAKFSR